MDGIDSVATAVCICAVISSILNMLLPQGSMKKLYGLIAGMFLLCCMVVPVKNALESFRIEINAESKTPITATADEAFNQNVIRETESILEKRAFLLLKQNGITINKCRIRLKNTDEFGILIDSVSIYINKGQAERPLDIKRIIREKFEVDPQVIQE